MADSNFAKVIYTLVGLVAATWFPTQAHAFEVDTQARCPAGVRVDSGADYISIVGEPDIFTAEASDTLIDRSIAAKVDMHTRLLKIADQPFSEYRTMFITKSAVHDGRQVCGWFNNAPEKFDILEVNAKKLTVGNYMEFTDPTTQKTKALENPLPLKVVLRSNPETDTGDAKTVSIYDRPSLSSQPRTDAEIFGVYYVYAERFFDDEDHWFWIAGEDPVVRTSYAGWVPVTHVIQWGSQLSLHFNEQSEKTDIFGNRRVAARYDKKGIISSRPRNFAENTSGPESPYSTNIPRFPIIEQYRSAKRSETIYQIGFFSDDTSVRKNSERVKVGQNVNNVDILFLLDNTQSMSAYFKYVVDAVRDSTKLIAKTNEENGFDVRVRYAAAVYGDYLNERATPSDVEFDVVANLGGDGYTAHLEKLTRLAESGAVFTDPVFRDRPEGGLAGIIRGVSEVDWSSNTEFKVVIWIGDHGSRNEGTGEGVGIDDVRRLMKHNSVLLYAINVSGKYDPFWNKRFIEQGNHLTLSQLSTRVTHDFQQSDDFDKTKTDIERAIASMYLSAVTTSIAIHEGQPIVEVVDTRKDLFELGIPAAQADIQAISLAICEQAFGSRGCANLKDTRQFMGEGYVKYDKLLDNFSFWVNLNRRQLGTLHTVLDRTCRGFDRGTVKSEIEKAMVQVQHALSLDDVYTTDMPVGEYLRRYLFLPAEHFPSFLDSTPDKIDEAWQDARQRDAGGIRYTGIIADPICRSEKLIELVMDGKRLHDASSDLKPARDIDNNSSYRWVVADNSRLIDFDWEWAQGNRNNYYYIPADYLPGTIPDRAQ